MSTTESSLRAHPFPMIRSGGLFVLLVGLGMLSGAILGENHLLAPLIVGACLAIFAQSVFRSRLVRPLGVPTRFQVMALISAIVLEMILAAVVAYAFHFHQSRRFWLWILLVVGATFWLSPWRRADCCSFSEWLALQMLSLDSGCRRLLW